MTGSELEYQPVVIIGAPRSGTNMLRDVLVRLPDTGTWPCDEINYIWRHGNIRYPSDEFDPEMATEPVIMFIRREFSRLAKQQNLRTVVEKTCANSLRVGFVKRVLPEAKFIFIYRNGLDVVASAMQRWRADMDPVYLFKKARYVPLPDLPYYGARYLMSQLYRIVSREKRAAFWGPRLSNMQGLLQQYSLVQVCGLQWMRCVEAALAAFSDMPDSSIIRVRYEDFVSDPVTETRRIAEFLAIQHDAPSLDGACTNISRSSVGKGLMTLEPAEVEQLRELLGDTLSRLGYV